MIGNESDAQFIRDYVLDRSERDIYGEAFNAPEGWVRLGSGCYRSAWLHKESNVVYKVQHRYTNDYGQSNAGEARNLKRYYLTKLPKGCRLPRFRHFELDGRSVMAMERFDKLLKYVSYYDDPKGYHARLAHLQEALRDLWDLHGANLAIDEENELLVPIDLGG